MLTIQLRRLLELVRENLSKIVVCLCLVTIFVIVYRNQIFFPKLITGVDFPIPANNPYQHLLGWFSSWGSHNLGIPTTFGGAGWMGPLHALFVFVSGGSQLLAQKLLFTHFLVASFMMYLFLTNHLTKSRPVAFIGAVIYAYSPVIAIGFGNQALWGYALLPLLFNYMLNIFGENVRKRDPLLFALTLMLTASFFSRILAILPLILLIFFLVYFIVQQSKLRYLKRIVKYYTVAAIVYFLLTFQSYSWFVLFTGGSELGLELSGVASLERFLGQYSEPHCQVLHLITLTAIPSRYWSFTSPIGFIFPILAFSSIFTITQHKKKEVSKNVFGFLFLLISLTLFVLSVRFKSAVFIWLYYHYPPISLLRSIHSIMFPMFLVYAYLIANTVNWMLYIVKPLSRSMIVKIPIRNRKLAFNFSKISTTVMLLLIVLGCFSYVPTYTISVSKEFGYFEAPSVYQEVVEYLRTQGNVGDFRYFLVPFSHQAQINLQNQYPYYFYAREGNSQPRSLGYVFFAFDSWAEEKLQDLGTLLAPANVKYVIVTLNTDTVDNRKWEITGPIRRFEYSFAGEPLSYLEALSSQSDLTLAYSASDFVVYRNDKLIPHIAVFPSSTYVVGDRESLISMSYLPSFDIRKNLLVFGDDVQSRESLLNVSSTITFNERDFNDLLMALLVQNFGIDLWTSGANTTEEVPGEWLRSTLTNRYYWKRGEVSQPVRARGFFTYGNGYIEATSNASTNIEFQSGIGGEHEIWVRVLYSPESTGNLTFALDGRMLNQTIKTKAKVFIGFKWVNLGSFPLQEGKHLLTIGNIGGYNAIDELIILPSGSLLASQKREKLTDFLDGKEIIFLFDTKSPLFKAEKLGIELVNCDATTGFSTWHGTGMVLTDSTTKIEGNASIKNEGMPHESGLFSTRYTFNNTFDFSRGYSLSFWIRVFGANADGHIEFSLVDENGGARRWYGQEPNKILRTIKLDTWERIEIPLATYSKEDKGRTGSPFDISAVKQLQFTMYVQDPKTTSAMWIDDVQIIDPIPRAFSYQLYLPREDYWSVGVRTGSSGQPFMLKIDGSDVLVTGQESNWYESEKVFLEAGVHEVYITFHSEAVGDRLAIYTGSNLTNVFSKKTADIRYLSKRVNEVKYRVEINSSKPVFVVLGESYHPEWGAYVDGEELMHFPAFSLTNGFYVNTNGTQMIDIKFQLQETHVALVSIRFGILIALLIFLSYNIIREPKPSKKSKRTGRRKYAKAFK